MNDLKKNVNVPSTALNTEELIYSSQQRNLVYNYDFKYFSNQKNDSGSIVYNHPDGWIYNNLGKDAQISSSDNSCRIVVNTDGNEMSLKQALHEFPRYENYLQDKSISLQAEVELSENCTLEVSLFDGIKKVSQEITSTDKGLYIFNIQLEITDSPSELTCALLSKTARAIISINKVFANIGFIAIETLPSIITDVIGERKQYIATENPPAEELSLCNAPIELDENQTRLNSVLNGRFGIGNNGNSLLLDMRGYFSRAWDNGSTIDPNATDRTIPGKGTLTGDHVSTFEQDDFLKHDHGLDFTVSTAQSTTGGTGPNTNLVSSPASKTNEEANGKETRPKNIYELYTIKWA